MTNTKTRIAAVIDGQDPLRQFRPNADFYQKVKIRRKRFAQIYRGDDSVKVAELKAIANYFNVSVKDLIDA